jgi:outer membrane lipoprotein-sorting protein
MTIRRATLLPCLLLLMAPVLPTAGQQVTAGDSPSTPGLVAPQPAENEAIAYLRLAEQKNRETKSLTADFEQTRIDNIFGDEVKSTGRFWYQDPEKFHAEYSYEGTSEKIWMRDSRMIQYIPQMSQVDIVTLQRGDQAPIHQMLLGFGAEVEKILGVFDVSLAEEDRPGLHGIAFDSKDLGRSLEFHTISIYFEKEEVVPRVIVAEASDNTFVIEMKNIRFNPRINERVFNPQWPDDVVVNVHGR